MVNSLVCWSPGAPKGPISSRLRWLGCGTTPHSNRIKRAAHRTQRTARAALRIVQHRPLWPPAAIPLHLQRQHMRRAHRHAPAAARAPGRVNGGQGFGGHDSQAGWAAMFRSQRCAVNRPDARRRSSRAWGSSSAGAGGRSRAAFHTPCTAASWGRESCNPHWPAAPW